MCCGLFASGNGAGFRGSVGIGGMEDGISAEVGLHQYCLGKRTRCSSHKD